VFSVGRLVSRRCHIIDSIAQVSSDLRYYEGSDPCRVIPQSRSPRLLRLTFLTFHPQPRDAPVHRFTRHFSVYGEFQASPYPSRLAANIPPNQVRHPTDRQFASGCFPPRLTATQLPSATEPWHAPTRTSTVLIRRPHGRTRVRRARPSFEPFATAHLVSTLAAVAEIPARTSEKPVVTALPE